MNKFRKIATGVLACSLLLTATSCKDFLVEEQKTKRDTDYFKTEAGLEGLAVSMYTSFKWTFSQEFTISFNQYGTDEFWVGGDNSNEDWNNYTSNLSSVLVAVNTNTTQPKNLWDNMYTGINSANIIINTADEVFSGGSNTATRDLIKGEAYFVRAFNYFKMVRQYGGVPLKLTPSDGVERYFTRNSAQEVTDQVIEDLLQAYNMVPATPAKIGKIYKDAVAHYLAKAYLFRASEINDSWNSTTKSGDLQNVITYCDQVINNHPLATNFGDLWYYTQPDGDNEKLSEVIFAAQYTFNKTANTGRNSNTQHFYFTSVYQNLTGFVRDIAGGREYQRMKTSEYMFDVYDLENDSRFWKSFRTKANLNNQGGIPNLNNFGWTYAMGDLGLIYIINKEGDQRFSTSDPRPHASYFSGVYYEDPETGKPVPHTYVRYQRDGSTHVATYTNRFPSMSKWLDGYRDTIATGDGSRDGPLARSADTYLMKAEALIRQNKYDEAIQVINTVRARAQYKSGEDRSAYWDGGGAYLYNSTGQTAQANLGGIDCCTFRPENSYYESLLIPETTDATNLTNYTATNLPAVDEAIIAKLGYSSEYDRMMCFLLNERSRELVGEFHRWEDLARTKTLEARVKAFNPTAAPNFNPGKHYLRPIPQEFLDQIQTEDGRALTADEKSAMQNPGY